jgi:hypothetical protein
MNLELSDDENVRIMVEQLSMIEERARFIVDIERRCIDGDIEVVDGPLTEADKRHLGNGSILMPHRAMAEAGVARRCQPAAGRY